MEDTQESATSTTGKASNGFTDEERAAMRARAQEHEAAARKADGESEVRAKIAEMAEADRALAERLHAIIKASAPALSPTTWYGMPAYAKNGDVICFFQSAQKFHTRYVTLGFSDKANLDDGATWPTAIALKELTAADEARIDSSTGHYTGCGWRALRSSAKAAQPAGEEPIEHRALLPRSVRAAHVRTGHTS